MQTKLIGVDRTPPWRPLESLTLALLGLAVTPHAFADHHGFTAADLDFADGRPVIMTEKDAVKCRDFDDPRLWMLPVHANLPPATLDAMIDRALQSQPQ